MAPIWDGAVILKWIEANICTKPIERLTTPSTSTTTNSCFQNETGDAAAINDERLLVGKTE